MWLYGGLPSSWSALTNLQTLSLANTGCLGSSLTVDKYDGTTTTVAGDTSRVLGALTSLRSLNLENAPMFTDLSAWLGSMSNLTRLTASYASLSGSLPTEIGRLTSFSVLDLSNNALVG